MEHHRTSPFDRPSQVFHGIRFVLLGFDPINKSEVSRKLVNSGAVDAGQYGLDCTHVIVDKLAYDDPACIAARLDGKILVTGLWVDHSFDVGAPLDTTSVMYRPPRDLNGIPGAKSLVMCLTGYQREDREDIMTMVELMGAQFSKPLIANKVTHLICYKFEGEKYLLAKKMKRIKLINHQWLEDCLKAWEIVSEADYSKSGYELEMEAEAKDSEEEPEGVIARCNEGKIASPHNSLSLKQEVSKTLLNASASKTLSNAQDTMMVTKKSTHDQLPNPPDIKYKNQAMLGFSNTENSIGGKCDPSNLFEGTTSGSTAQNIVAASTVANKSPSNEARKVVSANFSRKDSTRTPPPTINVKSNTSSAKGLNKVNLSDAFNMSSSMVQKVNDGSETALCQEDEQNGSFVGKRKIEISCGSSKLQKKSHNDDVESVFQELKKDPPTETSPAQISSSNISRRMSTNSKGKNVTCDVPISKTSLSKIVHGENLDAVQRPHDVCKETTRYDDQDVGVIENVMQGLNKSSPTVVQNRQKEYNATSFATSLDNRDVGMVENVMKSSPSAVHPDLQKSSTLNLEIKEQSSGSVLKSVKRKSIGKKFSAPKLSKKNTANQKGSIFSRNSELRNDTTTCMVDVQGVDDESFFKNQEIEKVPHAAKSGPEKEGNDGLQIDNATGNKFLCTDDETEPPEDKEEASKEKHEDGGPENTVDIVMEEKAAEEGLHDVNQNNNKDNDQISMNNNVLLGKFDGSENLASEKTSKAKTRKGKKKTALSVSEVIDKKAAKEKELVCDYNNEKSEIREDATPNRARGTKRYLNDLGEKSTEVKIGEGVCHNLEHKTEENDGDVGAKMDTENVVNKKESKRNKRPSVKTKKDAALSVKEVKTANKKGKTTSSSAVKASDLEAQKENMQIHVDDQTTSNKQVLKPAKEFPKKIDKSNSDISKNEPIWFILTGHKLQRREFQQIIRRLKGRVCRVSHQWSYQATHFIVPDPIRRTEKFFAAAASGSWILKTDYLSASNQAGRFLAEEPFEWYKNGLSEDGQVNLEAPRKWRLLKEKTGHGAFYGMRIIIYGECIAPSLDTLKRVVKAGDGTILATSPPYTRFLNTGIDFAIVSPGMPHVDVWVQEFIRHEIPCVSVDYLVEYVCKPGYPLEGHVQYNTNAWAERSYNNLKKRLNQENTEPRTPDCNDVACEVCGSRDRGEEMLICGDENGTSGCGAGTHIDCCDPPLKDVPEEDWFCPKCSNKPKNSKTKKSSRRKGSAVRAK